MYLFRPLQFSYSAVLIKPNVALNEWRVISFRYTSEFFYFRIFYIPPWGERLRLLYQ
jgi:hypothetical protein